MEEKKGLFKLGYVANARSNNADGETCFTILSSLIGKDIIKSEIDDFIESENIKFEYYGEDGTNVDSKQNAYKLLFQLPYKSINGELVYGYLCRQDLSKNFTGVYWVYDKTGENAKYVNLNKIGDINTASVRNFQDKQKITFDNINEVVQPRKELEYYNGGGYTQFPDGTKVSRETAKFIVFETKCKDTSNESIIGWFTKNPKGKFDGIDFGTISEFQSSIKNTQYFFVGRMGFESQSECNVFFDKLANKTLREPWDFKGKELESERTYPILRSYLEYELERLFLESEEFGETEKIVYSDDDMYLLFNTNLIDKFGHDLHIVGEIMKRGGKKCISNLQIAPSKLSLKEMHFSKYESLPPQFFVDINEIVFHCDWDVDSNMERYEHIIGERLERFPEKYRILSTDELGNKLDNAISFAQKIAQRNYKFIVPMYYPKKKRIQLLMPIYLENTYSEQPDFALVLTPNAEDKLYTPETILGLDEVYQDARLIAKPEESWLNPAIIGSNTTKNN